MTFKNPLPCFPASGPFSNKWTILSACPRLPTPDGDCAARAAIEAVPDIIVSIPGAGGGAQTGKDLADAGISVVQAYRECMEGPSDGGGGASVPKRTRLTPDDLGLDEDNLTILDGWIEVAGGKMTVHIDMIQAAEGKASYLRGVLNRLKQVARDEGMETLRLEGTFANDRFYQLLSRFCDVKTEGSLDYCEIKL